MDAGKILISRENPKAMSSDVGQKAPSPVLERFKSLMKQREEEIMNSGEEVSPPSPEEFVQLYEAVLGELTFNSKPIITDLTILAGEQREYAEVIADSICARIVEVPVDQKLPSLYLLDSIVKNIGRHYVRYFSPRLPEVFGEAYRQVHPNMRPAMRHLFGTWSSVFPPSVLSKIETQMELSTAANQQSSLRASESPRPTHGIHVNPKYLRQLEHSTLNNDMQHVRGSSSHPNVYGQNPDIMYDDFDSEHLEDKPSQVESQKFNITGGLGRKAFPSGDRKPHMSSTSRVSRPFSPSNRPLSSEVDEFSVDNSPRRGIDGTSQTIPVFDYALGRVVGRDNKKSEWQRKHYSDGSRNWPETSATCRLNNGHDHQRPRALIDAYGNDNGKRVFDSKPLQAERLDIYGMGNKMAQKSWQNTEEEEFDWEDMNPSLADHGRGNSLLHTTVPPPGGVEARSGFPKFSGSRLESDIWTSRAGQTHLPHVDSSRIAEDPVSSFGEIDLQMPVSATGVSSSGSEAMGSLFDKLPEGDQLVRTHTVGTRTGSSSPSLTGIWPPLNVQNPHPHSVSSVYPLPKQAGSPFDVNHGSIVPNQGHSKALYIPEKQFDRFGSKEMNWTKPQQMPNNYTARNQQNQLQVNSFQPQFLPSQDGRENFLKSAGASVPPQLLQPPLNHGYNPQVQNTLMGIVPSNRVPGIQPPFPIHNMPNRPMHLAGGSLPPLPQGPAPTHLIPISQSGGSVFPNQAPGSAYSGLITSLMSQGFISLTNQPQLQDSVGLEFNIDLLKVRHESSIKCLYADMPRQCTTCGLRFKCQEEHSSHMDWHVTKNRMSKNRKQKSSRKWFVSASMWLSGAEALGSDAGPGFLPTETVVEKKDDEEFSVPADEEQTACALCGEPFDDFYSDETEEWMYKGTVYMNAPNGSTVGMDRTQLGPIVHAKCRPDSSVLPSEDFGHSEEGISEEGSQRKKMRS